jgi:hypothetical protein
MEQTLPSPELPRIQAKEVRLEEEEVVLQAEMLKPVEFQPVPVAEEVGLMRILQVPEVQGH